ncbi:YncE family protein [Streptomyces sp. NPDC052396]|uniref:YncE family protein n=1 Tax=Streptomyces sp. NPDC052396 TaxID=3365689 RepID=UPI0037D28F56
MTDLLAVVSQSGPTVTFFDAHTHRRVAVIEVPPQPHELCFDPDHGLLYCTSAYRSGYYHANSGRASEVSVIDVASRRLVEVLDLAPEHGPHGLALDRRRGLLYVSVEAGGERPGGVVVLDTATRKRVGRVDTMAPGPHWFVLGPDGRRGYAANKEAPFVSAVDLEAGVLTGRIEVPGSEGLAVSPDGRHLYVAAPKADFSRPPAHAPGVRVIDTGTGRTERILPAEGPVMPVHTTVDGLVLAGELRVDGAGDSALGTQRGGTLQVFAPGGDELLARVGVGAFPLTITSSPDGGTAYVACVVSSTVSVVDLRTLEVTGELPVDRGGEAGAHGLAYLPGAL